MTTPAKALHQCKKCGEITESKLVGDIWDNLDKKIEILEEQLRASKRQKDDLHARLLKAVRVAKRQRDGYRDNYWAITPPNDHDRNEIMRENDREIYVASREVGI